MYNKNKWGDIWHREGLRYEKNFSYLAGCFTTRVIDILVFLLIGISATTERWEISSTISCYCLYVFATLCYVWWQFARSDSVLENHYYGNSK